MGVTIKRFIKPDSLKISMFNKKHKIPRICAGIGLIVVAIIANFVGRRDGFLIDSFEGLFAGIPFAIVTFFIAKSAVKNKLKFRWWEWIFYVLGWIAGAGNLLFWLIMLGAHQLKNMGEPFFSKTFHKRVVIWGVVITAVNVVLLLIALFIKFF
jgi:hypothetical protein